MLTEEIIYHQGVERSSFEAHIGTRFCFLPVSGSLKVLKLTARLTQTTELTLLKVPRMETTRLATASLSGSI
jgi:hypothetical protein